MRKRATICIAAMIAAGATAPAYAASFSPAGGSVSGGGSGSVNGTLCVASVVGSVDASGSYAEVDVSNSGAPGCSDFKVSARVWANGDLDLVKVFYLPSSPVVPVCDSGAAVYSGAVVLSNVSSSVVNAYLPSAVVVGACSLEADLDVGPAQVAP